MSRSLRLFTLSDDRRWTRPNSGAVDRAMMNDTMGDIQRNPPFQEVFCRAGARYGFGTSSDSNYVLGASSINRFPKLRRKSIHCHGGRGRFLAARAERRDCWTSLSFSRADIFNDESPSRSVNGHHANIILVITLRKTY